MATIEFDKLYKGPGRPSMKVKGTEFRRVTTANTDIMIDVYQNGVCTAHVWQVKSSGRWFEIPAGDSGSPREVKAPPGWVLK